MLQPALAGVHYFGNATSPFFDLSASNGFGKIAAAKVANTTAPASATVGGDVDWLLLDGTVVSGDAEGKSVQIYRVETVGGMGSCEGVDSGDGGVVSRQYAAQYWFYTQ